MKIKVIKGDITQLEVDVIVNAANNELQGGGGVDGAIHRAGGPQIMAECREIGYCETGEVVRTSGGNLAVKHLLHTVGPVFKAKGKSLKAKDTYRAKDDSKHLRDLQEQDLQLQSCYLNSINLAEELDCKSIAFPNISTGVYGFPRERAVELVFEVMKALEGQISLKKVVFCCFDEENYQLYKERFEK